MKRSYSINFFFLLICNTIYCTAAAQDTVFHAVNDPELMHYYGSHWFWIAICLIGFLLLMYINRRRKRRKWQDTAADEEIN